MSEAEIVAALSSVSPAGQATGPQLSVKSPRAGVLMWHRASPVKVELKKNKHHAADSWATSFASESDFNDTFLHGK